MAKASDARATNKTPLDLLPSTGHLFRPPFLFAFLILNFWLVLSALNAMAARASIDFVHRTVLLGLVGLGAGGIYMGVQVHRETLRRGRGSCPCILSMLLKQL